MLRGLKIESCQKNHPPNQFDFRSASGIADDGSTMDWEGGTIGAIVPALMGHGEAGRASPWPFSLRQPRSDKKAAAPESLGRLPSFHNDRLGLRE